MDGKVWDKIAGDFIDMPQSMKDFLEDIYFVCKKHNLSISHQDYGGAFIVEKYDEGNIDWLFGAVKNYQEFGEAISNDCR